MSFKKPVHVFAICAYKESPYLEECIASLLGQSVRSGIIMCTSTPCQYIEDMAKKYSLPYYVRDGKSGLGEDWNFSVETAVKKMGAELVTVAHQDDVYKRDYVKALMNAYSFFPDMSVFCSACENIDGEGKSISGKAERVKRLLRSPLRLRHFSDTKLIKRAVLSLGNSIVCPSCTYNISVTGMPLFKENYRFVTDWDALLRLAGAPGRFICIERPMIAYRIHSGAATKQNILNHNREREEEEMFLRLWPRVVVGILMHFYKKSYKAYN